VEWALLLLALIIALILRFYRLGQVPPGLYRDEAFNGLDALKVLQGEHAFFFPSNNGREPLYIYLTALAVALFGQTAFAVRLAAAVVGTLTTIPVYLLGKSWFGWRVGLLAAWIWAITLWPVHLSRIGLRVILLAPLLALSFWLGTLAYRRCKNGLWLLSGLLYGLTFYTYLAARFTPLLLIILTLFLLFTRRGRHLRPGAAWFVLGSLSSLLPFLFLVGQQPDVFLGRSGQVSVFHADVNGGDLWGTLWQHIVATLGMFIWRGDSILRHNPIGRPIFDLLMVIPFLLGLIWCVKHWHRPAALTLLIWIALMLGPTIFAADAPHFLRTAGILPAIIYLPAIGLKQIWLWPRFSQTARSLLVGGLLLGSLLLTIRDYTAYGRDPEVANAFESVAADLAKQLNEEAEETVLFLDEEFWSDWPAISFLVTDPKNVHVFSSPADLPQQIVAPSAIYAWPHEPLDYIPEVLAPPALISVANSGLVHGELDESSYQLFVRYQSEELPTNTSESVAKFTDGLSLHGVDVLELANDRLQVDLYWQSDMVLDEELVVFVHVTGATGLLGQHDAPPAEGRWYNNWWRSGQIVHDRHIVSLTEPYDRTQHQILIGLYPTSTGERLTVTGAANGEILGTVWTICPE
jgi:4-amino-4-deoxy-L-arabinose transferase-like glycosyltransferase